MGMEVEIQDSCGGGGGSKAVGEGSAASGGTSLEIPALSPSKAGESVSADVMVPLHQLS